MTDRWQERDLKRHRAIDEAVQAVHRTIDATTDGSVQETQYLIAAIAERLLQSALSPIKSAMMMHDFLSDHEGKENERQAKAG